MLCEWGGAYKIRRVYSFSLDVLSVNFLTNMDVFALGIVCGMRELKVGQFGND